MTTRAPNWFETKYKQGAIHALQTDGFLTKGMVQGGSNTKGNVVTWRLAGKGAATQMSTATEDRPVMNAGRTTVTGTMADYEANEWINTTDLEKMSEDEQQVAQQSAAYAIGRRYDKLLFETFDAATVTMVGTGAAAIAITDLMDAQSQILGQGINGVPTLYCALPFKLAAQLMLYREYSSSDFVGNDYPLLKAMGARVWNGLTIVPMPDEYFNVPAVNQVDGYMWMKQAAGFETNYDLTSRIDYVPEKKAYFAGNNMGMCSAVLLPTGVRRLRFATNVALARPTP